MCYFQGFSAGCQSKTKQTKLQRQNRAALRAAQGAIVDRDRDPSQLPESTLDYFRKRAVPDRLVSANVKYYSGSRALEVAGVQRRDSRQAQAIESGGWLAWGTTIDGGIGAVALIRPDYPRIDLDGSGKPKTVKFETPTGQQATPVLPFVDNQTAQEIYDRYGVDPLEGEPFWQVVQRCHLPIVITEGLAKALALIAHGIPAIALRGVACWHPAKSGELYPVIQDFATEGRQFVIFFDQDNKPKTVLNVNREISKMGAKLEESGVKVSVAEWSTESGKGIDDALADKGDRALAWLEDVISRAPDFKLWKKGDRIRKLLGVIDSLTELKIEPERESEGGYLPELPPLVVGAIHVLLAGMGTGKTERIGKDWIDAARAAGWNVLAIAPTNSLGIQSARRWNLPHRHDFNLNDPVQREAFYSTISSHHGLVCCAEALHHIPDWFVHQRPLLLVLDEAAQVIDSLINGNTLKVRHAQSLRRFAEICRLSGNSGAIVLSEASIPPHIVEFIQSVSASDKVRLFQHKTSLVRWEVAIGKLGTGLWNRLLADLAEGKKLILATSSQRAGRHVHELVQRRLPEKGVTRIDSTTNQGGAFSEFWNSPDNYLGAEGLPDLLILSPCAKSGVSITIKGFDAVYGHFPGLDANTHMQMLGRYRLPVPRIIAVPAFIGPDSGDEGLYSPRRVKQRLQMNRRGFAALYGIEEAATTVEALALETAHITGYSMAQSARGAQKAVAYDYLLRSLTRQGHDVIEVEYGCDAQISEELKQIEEDLNLLDATAIASATPAANQDEDWARKALDNAESPKETRLLAHKVLWRAEFPGVMFDDVEEVLQALVQNFGRMRRGVLLQARAENLDAAQKLDAMPATELLKQDVKLLHRLPKSFIRAKLVAECGVLALLDGNFYSNSDPRAIEVKRKALHWANEISYWLRLQIKPDQTPVEVCNKLLKKLGLEAEAIARPGRRGKQIERIYALPGLANPIRLRLLEAARSRLSEAVSLIRKGEEKLPLTNQGYEPDLSPPVINAGLPGNDLIGPIVRWRPRLHNWITLTINNTAAQEDEH